MKKKILARMAKLLVLACMLAGAFMQWPVTVRADVESLEAAAVDLEDGEYTITVELSGGTGRAAITSPAEMIVREGLAYARIEWSSSHYDYMIVGSGKYLPVNEEGNSVFEIPILVFNKEMPVIADTTAMSVPHEIEYQMIFHEDEIKSADQPAQAVAGEVIYMVILVAAVCIAMVIIVLFVFRRRRNSAR